MPRSSAPQPHWKIATTTPNDAPMLSRFITTALSGTSTDLKTAISRIAERITTMPMNSGSLPAR